MQVNLTRGFARYRKRKIRVGRYNGSAEYYCNHVRWNAVGVGLYGDIIGNGYIAYRLIHLRIHTTVIACRNAFPPHAHTANSNNISHPYPRSPNPHPFSEFQRQETQKLTIVSCGSFNRLCRADLLFISLYFC